MLELKTSTSYVAQIVCGPLDMSKPISEDLVKLEKEGVIVYDALYKVLVIAPLMCIICDNPRASELLNHLGSSASVWLVKLCVYTIYFSFVPLFL